MAFTHTRWNELQISLAARLDDPGNKFWTIAENYRYLTEALRAWNAYAQYSRERGSMNLDTPVGGLFFVDVYSDLTSLTPTVTDQDLIVEIQTALLEPENATGWSGTSQFGYDEIADNLIRRRNQFLLETGMVIHQTGDIASVIPSSGRYALDDKTIDVRRVAWRSLDDSGDPANYTTLWRTDEAALTSWDRSWYNPAAQPRRYSVAVTPPLNLQLAPPPNDSGLLNLLTVQTGPTLNPATQATVLGIPDDYCWIIKYGVLQDLLSGNSPSVDLTRAEYCQARWDEGVALARISASILNASINDQPVEISPLQPLDAYKASWMNSTPSVPYQILSAGWNLFMPFPIPDGVYGMTCDVIRNMPIPSGPSDFVQIGREFLDTILDYAFHLAAFKMGGMEFLTSKPNYDSLVQVAAQNNDKLRANSQAFSVLQTKEQAEGKLRPRKQSDINLQAMNYAK